MSILVIDDNVDFADSLRKLLVMAGYDRVSAVYAGKDGVKLALKLQPNFIFIDLQLLDIDGFAVARELQKKLKKRPTIVAITGYGRESDRSKTRAADFDFHLTKPVRLKHLKQILGDPTEKITGNQKVNSEEKLKSSQA